MSTDGCLTDESIFAFVQGLLPPAEVPPIEEHLSACPDCRSVVAETAKFFSRDEDDAPTGTTAEPSSHVPLAPGTRVSRYVISDVIGVGAAGVVYRAFDPELKRNIALKLLRTDHARELGPLKARLLREAQAMAQLSHPNVVSVFDVGTFGDEIFIVLELVEGQTLARWLGERPRPWRDIRAAFFEAGKGLVAAHAVQLVHRDFKPANVLVGTDGRVRVTDFGLARAMELEDATKDDAAVQGDERVSPRQAARAPLFSMTATEDGGLVGTPVYMAPEQFRKRRADARSDQFSFCIALYMALYRRHPYLVGASKLYTLEQLAESVTHGWLQVPEGSEVPSALFEVLRRGLCVDPKERFASMQELLDSLMKEAPLVPASSPRQRPRRWGLLLAGAALAVGAVLALSFSTRSPPIGEANSAASTPVVMAPDPPITTPEPGTLPEPAPPSAAATPVPVVATGPKRARPAHTPETKARRPAPPPGRERYVDGLKDPF